VREAEEGSVIVIERRGEPVAELRPLASPRKISREQREEMLRRIQKLWEGKPRLLGDSTTFLEEDRDRY
jgi:antitoxin (DNA-binding transcriptional repressor) of toxin-antitoxin stability system